MEHIVSLKHRLDSIGVMLEKIEGYLDDYKNTDPPLKPSRLFGKAQDSRCEYRLTLADKLAESRENYLALAETITDLIIQIDGAQRIRFANSAVKRIFGYERNEVLNKDIRMLFPDSRSEKYRELLSKYFLTDERHRKRTDLQDTVELLGKQKNGEVIPIEISIGNSRGMRTNRALTCVIRDISQRKKAERRLRYLAYHDKLTSLGNRDRFNESLEQVRLEIKRHRERHAALLYLDLDGFKKVNDSLGHETGDMILKMCAKRLSNCLRAEDQVYRFGMEDIFRLGGDEFTILLSYIHKPEDAAIVAKRVIDQILEPFVIEGYGALTNINMGVSVGIALIPEDGEDNTTLLSNADAAMYKAKEQGNTFVFFSKDLNNKAMERLLLEQEMRKALGDGEFLIYYQPIVDRNRNIRGVEALLRWKNPDRGLMQPDTFIHIAEETELILPIGKWGMETACRQVKQLQALGFPELFVSINLSPLQLRKDNFFLTLEKLLERVGFDSRLLSMEVREHTLMWDAESAARFMKELKRTYEGLQIAIDDFGTGFSSLSYLAAFPVDLLKIDKSFIINMDNGNNKKIVNMIIDLGSSLGLNIVAEGVENEKQFQYLAERGCHLFQGYHFFEPIPFGEVKEYLGSGGFSRQG